ncbi:hypothetical protein Nmel_001264 [Mimus melanotis]
MPALNPIIFQWDLDLSLSEYYEVYTMKENICFVTKQLIFCLSCRAFTVRSDGASFKGNPLIPSKF